MAERTTVTATTTTVTHTASPRGPDQRPGPHLADLREFVAACDGLPGDTRMSSQPADASTSSAASASRRSRTFTEKVPESPSTREWSDRRVVRRALEQALAELAPIADRSTVTVVHGAARGADSIAAQEAHDLGCRVKPWPANWGVHGKAAGPLRNQAMVDAGADVCLAFPLGASTGTRDCIHRASQAGIPVRVHEPLAAEEVP